MPRSVRIALVLTLAALAVPAVAGAAPRMLVGFQDDATFRWNGNVPEEFDRLAKTNASIVRATVDWFSVAPKRPRHAANPFDPAYNLADVDDFVRQAQQRGIEVLLTIYGTPKWANGGKGPNVPPRKLADLTNFARALARRYSGKYAGFPRVSRYSVWNEPNLGIFLEPQFTKKGKIIGPHIYANLYKAAYKGIKRGNRDAVVAIGETSNQGRDHPSKGNGPVSVAPATFARLLAQEKGLRFDAYATHPYSTRPNLPPSQKVRWPNVTLTRLKQFEASIDKWFHKKDIPIWITEYGYQTKPQVAYGVTYHTQSVYMSRVMRQLRADPRVHMFIWFIFRDSKLVREKGVQPTWQSGVYRLSGKAKPALRTFTNLAAVMSGQTFTVDPGVPPLITLEVPRLAYASKPGSVVGITYYVYDGKRMVTHGEPAVPLQKDGTVQFRAQFDPDPGTTYQIEMDANDINGNHTVRTYALVSPKPEKASKKTKHVKKTAKKKSAKKH